MGDEVDKTNKEEEDLEEDLEEVVDDEEDLSFVEIVNPILEQEIQPIENLEEDLEFVSVDNSKSSDRNTSYDSSQTDLYGNETFESSINEDINVDYDSYPKFNDSFNLDNSRNDFRNLSFNNNWENKNQQDVYSTSNSNKTLDKNYDNFNPNSKRRRD